MALSDLPPLPLDSPIFDPLGETVIVVDRGRVRIKRVTNEMGQVLFQLELEPPDLILGSRDCAALSGALLSASNAPMFSWDACLESVMRESR